MNALKSINARVKVLQKKHPKSKRTTLQKQAGREWKAGKLKKKKAVKKVAKRKPAKRKKARVGSSGNTRTATKASTSRNRTATKTITARINVGSVKRRKRRKAGKAAPRRRARVSGVSGSSLVPIVALAIGGILLYKFMQPSQQYPGFTNTSNPYRVQQQNSILQWATAAGLGIAAITQLINALNNSSDEKVSQAATAASHATTSDPNQAMNDYLANGGFGF